MPFYFQLLLILLVFYFTRLLRRHHPYPILLEIHYSSAICGSEFSNSSEKCSAFLSMNNFTPLFFSRTLIKLTLNILTEFLSFSGIHSVFFYVCFIMDNCFQFVNSLSCHVYCAAKHVHSLSKLWLLYFSFKWILFGASNLHHFLNTVSIVVLQHISDNSKSKVCAYPVPVISHLHCLNFFTIISLTLYSLLLHFYLFYKTQSKYAFLQRATGMASARSMDHYQLGTTSNYVWV